MEHLKLVTQWLAEVDCEVKRRQVSINHLLSFYQPEGIDFYLVCLRSTELITTKTY